MFRGAFDVEFVVFELISDFASLLADPIHDLHQSIN